MVVGSDLSFNYLDFGSNLGNGRLCSSIAFLCFLYLYIISGWCFVDWFFCRYEYTH